MTAFENIDVVALLYQLQLLRAFLHGQYEWSSRNWDRLDKHGRRDFYDITTRREGELALVELRLRELGLDEWLDPKRLQPDGGCQ